MTEAVEIVRQMERAVNAHDVEGVLKHLSESVVISTPGIPEARGHEPVRRRFEAMFRAFPDLHAESRATFGDDEWVCHEVVMQGTHLGVFAGPGGKELPATGKQVRFGMCGVLRVDGGKVVEVRDYMDRMELLAQLTDRVPAAQSADD